jgi:hypothetical protein
MMILLALAAAATAPQPGELKTFKDWIVGCDNGRACQAVALLPEDEAGGATMTVWRDPAANASPKITVTSEAKATHLSIDGKPTVYALYQREGYFELGAPQSMVFSVSLKDARQLALTDSGGKVLATVSLNGASAALRYIDDIQGRAGSVTAVVAQGPKPWEAVKPAPALPVIVQPPTTAKPPKRLSVARVTQLIGPDNAKCEYSSMKVEPEAYRLDARTSLVTVVHPCGNGAYNYFSSAFLIDESGKVRRAAFDTDKPNPKDGENLGLVNAGYDPRTRRLSSFMKGRGLGDCGSGQQYAWDGMRFRLIEQTDMGECRGSMDYITTWRATVR